MTIKKKHITALTHLRLLAIAWLLILPSCRRDLLDKNPRSDILIPSTLSDFQALLDNYSIMNETPQMGELSSDNYYLTYTFWQSLSQAYERNCYTWSKNIYAGQENIEDWNRPYVQVFHANIILEGLGKLAITPTNRKEHHRIKGSALFARALAFYNIAQLFAPVYDEATASGQPGIPLRLASSINIKTPRSTLQQTYDRILTDLQEAAALLPEHIPEDNRNRASRPAAFALLARVCISMRRYTEAGMYADSALQLYNPLMDYNELDSTAALPFTKENVETIFQARLLTASNVLVAISYPDCIIDSTLYRSYHSNDLRRVLYYLNGFTGNINLKGTYNGSIYPFTGLATDELYLVRAECYARAQNTSAALQDLNTLLERRWRTGTFVPVTADSWQDALAKILEERKKELVFRGLRWCDLRRLNKEGAAITLTRLLNGETYTLLPNSNLYVMPIPPDVITLSGIEQNPR